MNNKDASLYQSYLLRLWRASPQSPWRASLQSAATEELQHFATMEELWAFLVAQTTMVDDGWEPGDQANHDQANEGRDNTT